MERINEDISKMYDELIKTGDGEEISEKTLDFSAIRDGFRQHIHNRRSIDSSNLVLLDDQLIQNLKSLKELSFSLLKQFRDLSNNSSSKPHSPAFASFEDFVSFVVNQEEILNSEIWKLEAISNYLEEMKELTTPPPNSETQGL